MRSLAWLQLVAESELTANARLVAAMLACHSRGGAYPVSGAPMARVAGWTGLSKRACQYARDELVEGGWVVVVHGSKGGRTAANAYALVAPTVGRVESVREVIHRPRATPSAPVDSPPSTDSGVHAVHRGGAPQTPHEGAPGAPLKSKSSSRGETLAQAVDNIARRMAL